MGDLKERENNFLLSVVVPAYNTEKYIDKCLKSICHQTYRNLDIIVVDDGSTDNTGKICDEIARQDMRVRVIHKTNKGLVAARKDGIKAACASFITFVDSDDWIEPDMYTNMMEKMVQEKVDVITSNMYWEDESTGRVNIEKTSLLEGIYQKEDIQSIIYPKLISGNAFSPSLCNKILKTDKLRCIIENVNEDITLGEDAILLFPYILTIQSIRITQGCWYHYIVHKKSMVRTADINDFSHIRSFQKNMSEMLEAKNMLYYFQPQMNKYVRFLLGKVIQNVFKIDILQEDNYLFPFELIPVGSKVVLYGAGNVGISYWKCLQSCNYAREIYWVDKRYEELVQKGLLVDSPHILTQIDFDYVVIAIVDQELADEIKDEIKEIIKDIGEQKIVWKKPDVIL